MKNKIYLYSFVALVVIYLGLVLGLPADPEAVDKYNISEGMLRIIGLSFALPLVLVWASAAYAYLRFDEYADIVKNENEGPSFRHLTAGLMVLSIALPLSAVASSIFRYISRNNENFEPFSTIFINYMNLAFSAVAIILLAKGVDSLLKVTKPKARLPRVPFTELGLIIVTACYVRLVVESVRSAENSDNIYYMSLWFVVPTLVVPYLYIWYMGAQTVYRLNIYQKSVQGIVYKRAMTSFVRGLAVIIVLSVLLQVLGTLSAQLIQLKLAPLLAIVYLLVLFYIVGHGYVAYAARQLKKIEEV